MKETIGQRLRQAREARYLSLEQAAQATYIRRHYLQALEAGDLERLPSRTQARGFLRAYAAYLGLEADELIAELDREALPITSPAQPEQPPVEATPAAQSDETAAIYAEIGGKLQAQRELLGLSVEDIERHTRLRRRYLRSLEAGDFDDMPSPVQGRGMLKIYAEFLGLDADAILLRYADALQARLQATQEKQPARPARPRVRPARPWSPLRRLLSGEFLLTGLVVIALAGFITWGVASILQARQAAQPSPTAPSIVDVLLAPPTATITLTPEPPTSTPVAGALPVTQAPLDVTLGATLQATETGLVQVYVTVRQRAWMRALVDGKVEFEGRVLPGSAYQFAGDEQVEIITGNAAALQVFFNQQDLGAMGNFGQVVDRVYTVEGVQEPTPSITPTETTTPVPSPTARPSPTPAAAQLP